MMVLGGHLVGTRNFPLTWWPAGELGVRVFFVISGYLITTLLLGEVDRYGDISLGRFYLRRTFRIFPAYYAYLIAIMVCAAAGWVALAPGDAWHAFTYTTNYHPDIHGNRSWWMGHTWSLAVEEQFYLLWPAVLVIFGVKRGLHAAAAFVLLGPVIRLADFYLMKSPEWRAMEGESFWTIGDSIAIGCVLAMMRPRLAAQATWMRFQQSPLFWSVPVIGVLAYYASERYALPGLAVGQTVTIVCVAACIDWAIRFPDGKVGAVLNWRPLVFIGTLSYSLYLWQQPFLNRRFDADYTAFPQNIILAVAVALASYYLIEKPFLSARERIERRWLPKRVKAKAAAAA
jgi:peptidoglycan/LPS O-acetylase OafA/YrhL